MPPSENVTHKTAAVILKSKKSVASALNGDSKFNSFHSFLLLHVSPNEIHEPMQSDQLIIVIVLCALIIFEYTYIHTFILGHSS